MNFKWKIGDTVKPSGMPDPGYKIVGEKGDYWLMEGPVGRYIDNIPKDVENSDDWIEWTPPPSLEEEDAGGTQKRYKRKRKSKRMKSKRMKSKCMKSKRRKSKPL